MHYLPFLQTLCVERMNKAKAAKFRSASTKNDLLSKQHIRYSLRDDRGDEVFGETSIHFADVVKLNGSSGIKAREIADERQKILGHDEVS